MLWGLISPQFDFGPHVRPPWYRRAGMPRGSTKNASMTKAVAISSLKLLNGHLLGTARTLVGHGGKCFTFLWVLWCSKSLLINA